MGNDLFETIVGGVIFAIAVYYMYLRAKHGKWPKIRSPFYIE